VRQDREQNALARTTSIFAPRATTGDPIRAWACITFAAALFAPACALPTDVIEANQKVTQADEGDVTIKIDRTPRPCSGCAERDQLIASARAQAQR
jgi:hypothetical protein